MTLSSEQKEQFHSLLHQRLRAVSEFGNEVTKEAFSDLSNESSGDVSNNRLHASDLGINESHKETALKVAALEASQLVEIRQALERLVNGEYGDCESCGLPISLPRLEALPEARLCIECQILNESEQKARRRPHEPDERTKII
jgi:DnaK suppressor protein